MENRIKSTNDYDEAHRRLVQYLEMKTLQRDWHGVSDAANDLRVLEAQSPHPHG